MRRGIWVRSLSSRSHTIHSIEHWRGILLAHQLLIACCRSWRFLLLLHLSVIGLIRYVRLRRNILIILLLSSSRWVLGRVDSLCQKGIDAWSILYTISLIGGNVLFLRINWVLVRIVMHTVHSASMLWLFTSRPFWMLWLSEYCALKILECYHNNCNIIKGLAIERVL
jgi:hypothetical protein